MTQLLNSNTVKIAGLIGMVVILLIALEELPAGAGQIDYRAYWSASYLLGQGENFAEDVALIRVQQTLTASRADYAMKTWNPPWVLAWLLPYTWVPFALASKLWLLTNITALFFSIITSWQMMVPAEHSKRGGVWAALLVALLFPSTIVSLLFGQVNLMVLAGMVGFLHFYRQKRDVTAGMMLALTTFKPHLVYLVVPLFLLHAVRHRRWQLLGTFLGILATSVGVALSLRPSLVKDYLTGTIAGNLIAWETATLVSFISLKTNIMWLRLIAIGLMPLVLLVWLAKGQAWQLMLVAQVGVIASVITMPFGWSYDFVVLLLPMTQIVVWLVTKRLPVWVHVTAVIVTMTTYGIYFRQRIETPSELYFFWVPLVIAALYGLVWHQAARHEANFDLAPASPLLPPKQQSVRKSP